MGKKKKIQFLKYHNLHPEQSFMGGKTPTLFVDEYL